MGKIKTNDFPLVRLTDIQPENMWRLFIDRKAQYKGPQAFDKDISKGFLRDMFCGFNYVLATLGEQLSVEMLLELHKLTTLRVKNRGRNLAQLMHENAEGGFYLREIEYSVDGLEELIQGKIISLDTINFGGLGKLDRCQPLDIKEYNASNLYAQLQQGKVAYTKSVLNAKGEEIGKQNIYEPYVLSSTLCGVELEVVINTEINNYYEAISIAEDDLSKIQVIAKLIRFLLVLHPFYDGNGRVFRMLLLNKLLIENKLGPTNLAVQEIISLHSMKEISDAIIEGQQFVFESCVKGTPFVPYSPDTLFRAESESKACLYLEEKSTDLALLVTRQILMQALTQNLLKKVTFKTSPIELEPLFSYRASKEAYSVSDLVTLRKCWLSLVVMPSMGDDEPSAPSI